MLTIPGATYRQLDHWARAGYLRVEAPGSGQARHWPAAEVDVARRMAALVAEQVAVARAAELARHHPDVANQVAALLASTRQP